MLFLIISTPSPGKPADVKDARIKFREWLRELEAQGKAKCFYPRPGRGAVVIFEVISNEELHEFLTQWGNLVPAQFDIYPLVDPAAAAALLK